ncbi:hypothetical protein AVEN_98465-1 [Araneus ventricosus]|uniref:Helitron helicase-like domain-containing protein n=1 Tax=Araneus ventricosus TaxID=182803 RepID=A0A4Y1ZWI8_ARAVE|nr:hypothetical protein AVEN_98465-1 [Araneus ventricosus]
MVVWIEGHSLFDAPEGIEQIDSVCTCDPPLENTELHDLVRKIQQHRHTHTCKKNDARSAIYRLNFPRQVCSETRIVAHSSDDFIRSGRRICLQKRRKEDICINNYSPTLQKLWGANMDIQPCGSNESIAYYSAKYMSKAEPVELDPGIRRAVQLILHEECNIFQRLFKICIRMMKERQLSACECV